MLRYALLIAVVFLSQSAWGQSRQPVDLIVYGDYLLTMEEGAGVLEKGAVAVRGDTIVAVGSASDINAQYQAKRIIEGEGRALMPGLVNGHTHTSMVLFRGMADDLPLMTWLQNYIFPMEGRYVDETLVEAGTRLACWEMIKSGTTSFVDMYFYPDVISDVTVDCGMRAIVGAPMIDFPSPGFKGWDDSYAAGVDYARRWKDKHPRITPALAPHAPYTVSVEHLQQAFSTARELGVPVSIHVSEDRAEINTIADRHGMTPIELLAGMGMLDQQTVAAHVVWPSDSDIEKLAGSQAGPIHNPTSNMKTGAGISPVAKMLEAGVNVGLGTDGAASNNDLNLWQEMRFAALIHKGVDTDPTLVSAGQALDMATRMGAAAVGLGDQVGVLKPGMKADMIQVSLDSPRFDPLYNVISHLVYVATGADVTTSIIDGNVVMENGEVLTIDVDRMRQAVSNLAQKIRQDLKKVE